MKQLLEPQAFTYLDKIISILIALGLKLLLTFGMGGFLNEIVFSDSLIPPKFFILVILAPLYEELVFRVVPIKIAALFGKESLFPIIVLASVIFGLGHSYQYSIGSLSLLFQGLGSLIYFWLYIRNGYSYLSIVTLHATWNLLTLIA